MTRPARVAALAAFAAVLAPSSVSARIVELGQTSPTVVGSCPGAATCRVVTRTTGYQAHLGTIDNPFAAPSDGRIVAFTTYLGDPSKKEKAFFDGRYGGDSRVGLTILREVKRRRLVRQAVGESGIYWLAQYFGTTAQFPLQSSLPVRKGDIVAMSVPTWAPILAIGQDRVNTWRASRPAGRCDDFETLTAQLTLKSNVLYGCKYGEAQLAYSVTFVSTPRRKYDRKHRPVRRRRP
jgi:hypothetical protein